MNRTLMSLLVCLAALWSVTACNTVNGVGKDVEHGGQAIQDATKK
jgi:entericidin B